MAILWYLLVAALVGTARTRPDVPDLTEATLEDLSKGLAAGCFTSVDLVDAYIARIREVNDQIHAVTEFNPDALDLAETLDKERARNFLRRSETMLDPRKSSKAETERRHSPLHGIPILLKNSIVTKDKINNTAGSTLLVGAEVPRDAEVVKRLRVAGAIILGKANLSQWSALRSSSTTAGWSAHGGQALGGYHAEQNPSGSSSGSAVATDLGLAFAAVGVDTTGSISHPAHRGGIVGIRPSLVLTSTDLVIPLSGRLDAVGPMARTVRDAAHILSVLAGKGNFVEACDKHGLAGVVIGIPAVSQDLAYSMWGVRHRAQAAKSEAKAYQAALDMMRAAGARIVKCQMEWSVLNSRARSLDVDKVLQADFKAELPTYLDKLTTNPHNLCSLDDVINKTQQSPHEGYPGRDTSMWDTARLVGHPNSTEVQEAWARLQDWTNASGIGAVHALVVPTMFNFIVGVGLAEVTVPLGHYPKTVPVRRVGGLGPTDN